MTDIEIQSTGAGTASAQPVTQESFNQPATERVLWSGQNFEQRFGGALVEDASQSAMLNDSLSLIREVLQIGEANTVDSRRSAALPPAPHQTTNVE